MIQAYNHCLLRGSLNILGLKTLESSLGDLDMGDQGVELVDRVFILVPESGQTNSHPEGDTSHSLRPDCLVESGVNSDILGSHLLLSKLLDFLNSQQYLTIFNQILKASVCCSRNKALVSKTP